MTMRSLIAVALAVGLSGAASAPGAGGPAFQTIEILRPVGAQCTFVSGGTPVEVKRRELGQNPAVGYEADFVRLPARHADITLTCRGADGWSETQTLVYGPSDYTSFNGPCGPGATCPQKPWTSKYTVYEYPGVVRMGPYRNARPQH